MFLYYLRLHIFDRENGCFFRAKKVSILKEPSFHKAAKCSKM